ncbi:hypothetical protein ACFV6F_30835, partial [Kitasatospora phosalacinea]
GGPGGREPGQRQLGGPGGGQQQGGAAGQRGTGPRRRPGGRRQVGDQGFVDEAQTRTTVLTGIALTLS